MAASTTLMIKILADASQAAKTAEGASGRFSKFGGAMRKAALPAAAIVAGIGAMGKAAADDARGQAILANTLSKTTGATAAQIAANEDWISTTAAATGVADDQLRPALGQLATATGSVTESQKAMSKVLDVSAATGKDTETVATAVAKAYAGNTASLGKLVPGLDKATLKSGDMNAIMDELAKKTGGAAAAAANTASGKWQRAALAFDETKESIGAALLPALDKLGTIMGKVGKFAQNHAGILQVVALAALAFAAGVIILNGVMAVSAAITTVSAYATKTYAGETKLAAIASKLWAGAQWLLNAALTANPIVLVIVAIVALVAIVVIAYKKSATFRSIVSSAFNAVADAATFLWNVTKAAGQGIVVAFQWIIVAAKAVWAFIRTMFAAWMAGWRALWNLAATAGRGVAAAFQWIANAVRAVWSYIRTAFATWMNIFRSLWNLAVLTARGIAGAFGKIMDGVRKLRDTMATAWGAIKGIVKGAADFINGIIDGVIGTIKKVIDWISKIKIPAAVGKILGKIGLSSAPPPAATSPPPPPLRAGRYGAPVASTSTGGAARSAGSLAGILAGVTFQLAIDGKVVAAAVQGVTVSDQRALARKILNGRPVG